MLFYFSSDLRFISYPLFLVFIACSVLDTKSTLFLNLWNMILVLRLIVKTKTLTRTREYYGIIHPLLYNRWIPPNTTKGENLTVCKVIEVGLLIEPETCLNVYYSFNRKKNWIIKQRMVRQEDLQLERVNSTGRAEGTVWTRVGLIEPVTGFSYKTKLNWIFFFFFVLC